jgi:hypothetical protein
LDQNAVYPQGQSDNRGTTVNINVGAGLSKNLYEVQNSQIKTRPPHQSTTAHKLCLDDIDRQWHKPIDIIPDRSLQSWTLTDVDGRLFAGGAGEF